MPGMTESEMPPLEPLALGSWEASKGQTGVQGGRALERAPRPLCAVCGSSREPLRDQPLLLLQDEAGYGDPAA